MVKSLWTYVLSHLLLIVQLVEGQSKCGSGNATATFDLTLAWKELAPDGYKRRIITVNEQYPGPLLRIQQGSDVKVTVVNKLDQPSSIHWHGIDQRGSPDMDGVAGVTQAPIAPGETFTYCFSTARQAPGTYVYHAHMGSQYPDGLYGPIIIDPTEQSMRVYENQIQGEFVAILNDWYHREYESLVHSALATNRVPACANSLLINGKGRVQCGDAIACTMGNDMGNMGSSNTSNKQSSITSQNPVTSATATSASTTTMGTMPGMVHRRQMPPNHSMPPSGTSPSTATPTAASNGDTAMTHPGMTLDTSNLDGCAETAGQQDIFTVKANGVYRFRFANIGAFTNLHVSIDQHKMKIIEADGILLKDNQIVDVLTVAIGQRYSVLVKADQAPSNYWVRTWRTDEMQKLEGRAILRYEGAPTTDSGAHPAATNNATIVFSDSLQLKPLQPTKPPNAANKTLNLGVRAFADNNWTLQGDIPGYFPEPKGTPLLVSPVTNPNIISLGYGDIVDLVLQVDKRSSDTMAHPFHLHGQSFWVMGSGNGTFDPAKLNTNDPPFRDTELLPANGWLVLRFIANNPGTWFFHCHVDLHMMAGLNLVFDVARTNLGGGGHSDHSGASQNRLHSWCPIFLAAVLMLANLI